MPPRLGACLKAAACVSGRYGGDLSMTVKHVYIVDDDAEVCQSMVFFLSISGFAAEAFASAPIFLEKAGSLAPGCVLLDVRMPEMNGVEMLASAGALRDRFAFVAMTGHGDITTAAAAMAAGALDFIEKPFEEELLLCTLDNALVSSQRQVDHCSRRERTRTAIASLTPRERDALDGIVAGWSNKVIASHCKTSVRTVEVHRTNLMQKLKARSASDLVKLALEAGVIGVPARAA